MVQKKQQKKLNLVQRSGRNQTSTLSCGTESCDNKERVQKGGSRLPRQPEQLKCPLAVNHQHQSDKWQNRFPL